MSFVNVIGVGGNDDPSLDERGHKALLVLQDRLTLNHEVFQR